MAKSPLELEDRASDARALLNNKVLNEAFEEMQAEYIQLLIQAPVGDLTATTAHASMKVLEAVKAKLHSFVNDASFINKRGR
jgi:hypothetical protein